VDLQDPALEDPYSAQLPGKSFTHAISPKGTSPVWANLRTRLRWVCPARYPLMAGRLAITSTRRSESFG